MRIDIGMERLHRLFLDFEFFFDGARGSRWRAIDGVEDAGGFIWMTWDRARGPGVSF